MLGKKVKCMVTGFTGIATARCEYLNGCIQFKVEAKMDKDGNTKMLWVDGPQLQIVGEGPKLGFKTDGGPAINMPGSNHP